MKATTILSGFVSGLLKKSRVSRKHVNKEARAMRTHMSEKEFDRMLRDTFPASDPVAFY